MDSEIKDILNNISDVKPPKGLKQAVFKRIELEKLKSLSRKKMYLRLGFVASGLSSVVTSVVLGKEIMSSEFYSLVLLIFSDIQTVAILWQSYVLSLLETLPTVSIAVTLLPVFIFMTLLRQYGKLEQQTQHYLLKH